MIPLPLGGGRIRPALAGPDWIAALPDGKVGGLRTSNGFALPHVPLLYRPGLLLRDDRVLLQWWTVGGDTEETCVRWADDLGWQVASMHPPDACARILHGLSPHNPPDSAHLRLAGADLAQAIGDALARIPPFEKTTPCPDTQTAT